MFQVLFLEHNQVSTYRWKKDKRRPFNKENDKSFAVAQRFWQVYKEDYFSQMTINSRLCSKQSSKGRFAF